MPADRGAVPRPPRRATMASPLLLARESTIISGKAHDAVPGVDEPIRKCSIDSFARAADPEDGLDPGTLHAAPVNRGDRHVSVLHPPAAPTTTADSSENAAAKR